MNISCSRCTTILIASSSDAFMRPWRPFSLQNSFFSLISTSRSSKRLMYLKKLYSTIFTLTTAHSKTSKTNYALVVNLVWLLSPFQASVPFLFHRSLSDNQIFSVFVEIKKQPWSEMRVCTKCRKINLNASIPHCNKLAYDNKFNRALLSENSFITTTNFHKYNKLAYDNKFNRTFLSENSFITTTNFHKYNLHKNLHCKNYMLGMFYHTKINKRIHILRNDIRNFLRRIFFFSIFDLALKPQNLVT